MAGEGFYFRDLGNISEAVTNVADVALKAGSLIVGVGVFIYSINKGIEFLDRTHQRYQQAAIDWETIPEEQNR